ncbi:MAG: hypothetical protein ACRDFB_06245 [Rhabdochlamydiaceae bacterium]
MTIQPVNSAPLPVFSNLPDKDEIDLEAIMNATLKEMGLEETTTEPIVNPTRNDTPSLIPDTSYRDQQEQVMMLVVVGMLKEQVQLYKDNPIALENFLKTMTEFELVEKELIIPYLPLNSIEEKKVKILIEKFEKSDHELFSKIIGGAVSFNPNAMQQIGSEDPTAMMEPFSLDPAKIEEMKTQSLEIIDRLIREGKAIDVTSNENSHQIAPGEMEARVKFLKEFDFEQERCQKIAEHDEFVIALQMTMIHIFSNNEDIIPLCVKVLASQKMVAIEKMSNPMNDLKILQEALSAERFMSIKQQYVSYLIEKLKT